MTWEVCLWSLLGLEELKFVFFFSILGVSSDVSDDDIRRQYRKLAMLIHPDKVGGGVTCCSVSGFSIFPTHVHLFLSCDSEVSNILNWKSTTFYIPLSGCWFFTVGDKKVNICVTTAMPNHCVYSIMLFSRIIMQKLTRHLRFLLVLLIWLVPR